MESSRPEEREQAAGSRINSKNSRSRSGCSVCRARKVKCDERPGSCLNCNRLHVVCPGYGFQTGSLQSYAANPRLTQAGTERRRNANSCTFCRSAKTRCTGDKPRCARCRKRNLQCSYMPSHTPAWVSKVPETAVSSIPSTNFQHVIGEENIKESPSLSRFSESNTIQSPNSYGEALQPMEASPGALSDSEASKHISWMFDVDLPTKERIYTLIDDYFANVHHLRCFAFIHRPSLMQSLDRDLTTKYKRSPLLYIMCALGAKFCCLREAGSIENISPDRILEAGNQWAEEAKKLIFADLNHVSVELLMASVLLHDHEIRIGRYISALMLSATCVRMAQALQFNLEGATDIIGANGIAHPSPSSREARRRLMWSIYVIDSWVGSGVDMLTLLDDADLKIQLPCHERNFTLQIPCITETLEPGQVLQFISQEQIPGNPSENIGMLGHFVRIASIRKKALRYIKRAARAFEKPWEAESELTKLVADMKDWRDNLPANMDFSPSTRYARKDTSQLGSLCLLHCTYHQTLVNLYQIALPRLFKMGEPVKFPPEQQGFLIHLQEDCFNHSREAATILKETAFHGIRMISDAWFITVAHESLKIMLYYLANLIDKSRPDSRDLLIQCIPLLRSDLEILRATIPMYTISAQCYTSAVNMLESVGLYRVVNEGLEIDWNTTSVNVLEEEHGSETPSKESPDAVLNPLAIYRMARTGVSDEDFLDPNTRQNSQARISSNDVDNAVQFADMQAVSEAPNATNSGFMDPPDLYNPTSFLRPLGTETGEDLSLFPELNQQFPMLSFDMGWQPLDTALDSFQGSGLFPWDAFGDQYRSQ